MRAAAFNSLLSFFSTLLERKLLVSLQWLADHVEPTYHSPSRLWWQPQADQVGFDSNRSVMVVLNGATGRSWVGLGKAGCAGNKECKWRFSSSTPAFFMGSTGSAAIFHFTFATNHPALACGWLTQPRGQRPRWIAIFWKTFLSLLPPWLWMKTSKLPAALIFALSLKFCKTRKRWKSKMFSFSPSHIPRSSEILFCLLFFEQFWWILTLFPFNATEIEKTWPSSRCFSIQRVLSGSQK